MKAMILAAGRGERMKPLTDKCPKPLLTVKETPLIVFHIKQLSQVGIKELVINHAWLGHQIEQVLGNGERWNVNITYSPESDALETAGGIINALPLLVNDNNSDDNTFLVINGDVFTDFDFEHLPLLGEDVLAHLWLVPNPEHNIKGDFSIENGLLQNIENLDRNNESYKSYTYSGIALFKPKFFGYSSTHSLGHENKQISKLPLAPMLRAAADNKQISASILPATWTDVGTPKRLAELNL